MFGKLFGNSGPRRASPKGAAGLGATGHVDTFTRDNLPPAEAWPDLLLDRPEFQYPEHLNAAVELTDRMVERGFGDRVALIGNGRQRTYKELTDWSNRLAHALVEDFGVRARQSRADPLRQQPGDGGGVAGGDQGRRRRRQHHAAAARRRAHKIVDKAEVSLALCDSRIADELVACAKDSRFLKKVINFDGTANHDAELDRVALSKPVRFQAVQTGRDDVALLGFTSGTTGEPKATMHFHRDLLIMADGYAKEVLGVTPGDVFVGSPPLAFTFGLGGLAVFPLRFGATATLLENASPANMIDIIETYKGHHQLHLAHRLSRHDGGRWTRARTCPRCAWPCRQARPCRRPCSRTGRGRPASRSSTASAPPSSAHLHHQPLGDAAPGATGRCVAGLRGQDRRRRHERGGRWRDRPSSPCAGPPAAATSPTSGRAKYVRDGWNLTGDDFPRQGGRLPLRRSRRRHDHLVGLQHRRPGGGGALLAHPEVAECAVVGAPDVERGQIVEAHVVLREGVASDDACIKRLQDHVKATIAPYKYPRSVRFVAALPKTQTGKIQRFRLRPQR
jgi:2-aminobenzoate-CoA ligase